MKRYSWSCSSTQKLCNPWDVRPFLLKPSEGPHGNIPWTFLGLELPTTTWLWHWVGESKVHDTFSTQEINSTARKHCVDTNCFENLNPDLHWSLSISTDMGALFSMILRALSFHHLEPFWKNSLVHPTMNEPCCQALKEEETQTRDAAPFTWPQPNGAAFNGGAVET